MKGDRATFEALQAKWRKLYRGRNDLLHEACMGYSCYWRTCAPKSVVTKIDRTSKAEDRARDAIYAWLEKFSPRAWDRGVPSYWVCGELGYQDAIRTGPLTVVPPPAMHFTEADMRTFAQAV